MRADLVNLGLRLGWVGAEEKEELALLTVMERLRHEAEGILLIFDNARDADALKPYLPRGGSSQVLVTSNARAWRGVATPVEIGVWSKAIGADYLIARTGRDGECEAAKALSETLGGLPLAHEQAAAYCERLEVPFDIYRNRLEAAPARVLDDQRHAPAEYYGGMTVAKTFALAIEEAGALHPAAELLIVYAALLAPEPIPLFLFAEGCEKFGEPLASALADEGLDEAVAALRAFALVHREMIADARNPAISIDTIRLHCLVSRVASARPTREARDRARHALIDALASVYPEGVFNNPETWPRARRLNGHVLAQVGRDTPLPTGAEQPAIRLLNRLAAYRHGALGAYARAHPLYERAVRIGEQTFGREHPDTATSISNLASVLRSLGRHVEAEAFFREALAIGRRTLGDQHPHVAIKLSNLGSILQDMNRHAEAEPLFEDALAICGTALGPEHPCTATSCNNLALLLRDMGRHAEAEPLYQRALQIREATLGAEHPHTATSLNNLAGVCRAQGRLQDAEPLYKRALTSREAALGIEHPHTVISVFNLALLYQDQGRLSESELLFERARPLLHKVEPLYERVVNIRRAALGPDHPDTAQSLFDLVSLYRAQGRHTEAEGLHQRVSKACGAVLEADLA